mmetsp:Transcript_23883/g.28885  ORF Transcript_23883/g.28885 Transcript_23883/m.28885 type:complete len:81 (+) Transcript_23883:279-521(+)|eukprot:CAMPEP_0197848166 /NCGR_PEP_ID=MMETSP1438-20131217/7963_1 /TAXON_ID=1461541 /ORGANISM="Pterosperma sp., Strain CCMP1384" /LENGTH=80 /DNA_ID=CAMNT_0043460305 /DNA_START=274 /DNA_END=516 /DNA_ORIENTATION=+
MSQAFGAARYQPKPPEKGVFPLDHFGECKPVMDDYMSCMKTSKGKADECRALSKAYLQCRMNKGLMAKQDLDVLGFADQD